MIAAIVRRAAAPVAALWLVLSAPAVAQAQGPIALHVDASRAVQGLLSVHETIPVAPGPLTLVYPKWIPGEHGPNGPIQNLAGLSLRAGGATLPWRRDPVDLFAFHLDVPPGVASLDVTFEYLGAQSGSNSVARFSTPASTCAPSTSGRGTAHRSRWPRSPTRPSNSPRARRRCRRCATWSCRCVRST